MRSEQATAMVLEEKQKLQDQIGEYSAAVDDTGRRAALLPKDEIERFHAVRKNAAAAVYALPSFAREVMRHEVTEGPMPPPNDFTEADEARAAQRMGDVQANYEEMLVTNRSIDRVDQAWEAYGELRFLLEEGGLSEDFDAWFRRKYGAPPNLSLGIIWDALIG